MTRENFATNWFVPACPITLLLLSLFLLASFCIKFYLLPLKLAAICFATQCSNCSQHSLKWGFQISTRQDCLLNPVRTAQFIANQTMEQEVPWFWLSTFEFKIILNDFGILDGVMSDRHYKFLPNESLPNKGFTKQLFRTVHSVGFR